MIANIGDLRRRGILFVTLGGWAVVLVLCIMALAIGEDALTAAAISALLNLVPTWNVIRRRQDVDARLALGVMAALQPSLMLYAMQGSLWQIDMHLYFFVALAALTLLWDIRPIVLACSIIIVHHAILAFAQPDWVFWGGGSLVRVMLHGIATALIGSILGWITFSLRQLLFKVEDARRMSEAQAAELSATTSNLEAAIEAVKAEQELSARAREEASRARAAVRDGIAAEFEASVSAVTDAVADTASMFERTARGLKSISQEAGGEAQSMVGSAVSASKAANTVAAGVAEMSLSIAGIAINVGQQSDLTSKATKRSGSGGEAIGMLTEQSKTIGEATRAIVRIAERTDLLSLNAAIEAASAGVAGRGFTIVAQEVKALAQQAAEAATQIDAFLSGVRSGTFEAERSFKAIDAAIADLDRAAHAIRYDVDNQRQSADTIEGFARNAAEESDAMVERTRALAERASAAHDLAGELEIAAAALAENVRNLERSTEDFKTNLKAA